MAEVVFWQSTSNIQSNYRTLFYITCLQKAFIKYAFLEIACQNIILKLKGNLLYGHIWKKDDGGKHSFGNAYFTFLEKVLWENKKKQIKFSNILLI